MIDRATSVLSLIIIGGIAIRIATNANSAKTISTVFHGLGEDITASFGK